MQQFDFILSHFLGIMRAIFDECIENHLHMLVAHAAEGGIAIHLAPPVVGHIFSVPITSTMLIAWLTVILLILFSFTLRRKILLIPGKLQLVVELVVGGIFDYMNSVLKDEVLTKKYFPLIATIFLFVLSLNWIGLLPGVDAVGYYHQGAHGEALIPFLHPANTDLNMTIAIAIIAFFSIEAAGVLAIGLFKYVGKFINFKSPLKFVVGIIELFSEMARLISFSFRLFGNIFAGKTLLLITMFFVPFVLPVPILAFEVFVGFIQAFIFAVLTLFFIKLAVEEPH